MITAVDTSVVIDILAADERYGTASDAALRHARQRGALVACEVVWAEVNAGFASEAAAADALHRMQIQFGPIDDAAASLAGRTWRAYRAAGGARTRIVGDFLIGAHAAVMADQLLTRDRGFFRTYFRDLPVVTPVPGS